jgi:hypothetical protein
MSPPFALEYMAASCSTSAVATGHLVLKRAIRRAEARRYVRIISVEFAETRKDDSVGQANLRSMRSLGTPT